MALLAFDLDNTLGLFDMIAPWADMFSVETLKNPFNQRINPHFKLSASLVAKLRVAEQCFITKVMEDDTLLASILRPNLDAIMGPVVRAWKKGKVRAVCIYSNTWCTFTMYVAKDIIETLYNCPGLFSAVVDATHPIRGADWKDQTRGEPLKTLKVLKRIFRELCGVKGPIDHRHIAFVDERAVKHQIEAEEVHGLLYVKPTDWRPKVTQDIKVQSMIAGMATLAETRLDQDREFLASDVCHCLKYDEHGRTVAVKGFMDLFTMTERLVELSGPRTGVPFVDDGKVLRRTLESWLREF